MIILYVILGLLVVFMAIAAAQPADFTVTRSGTISAPAENIFGCVNDLHKFQEWSPWAKVDPNCKTTYSGPTSGPGASFAWSGNMKVGEGGMTVMESQPSDLVRLKLEFLRPMRATNTVEFTFRTEGGTTTVKWSMMGKKNFGAKVFGLFVNCDKMCGADFERGLANLKALCELQVAHA
jgi:uncharacterized protein YndB with AHSA1/START domain